MRIRVALLACALVLPATASFAGEKYMCTLTTEGGDGVYKQDASQYVALSIDKKAVRPVIHIAGASKDLTFSTCKNVAADGSNFSHWFQTECRDLKSVDGKSYTIEPFLAGAYAGISPVIDQSYSMYDALESISKTSSIKLPERTFAIYANRKPVHEFFCYGEKP
jgi:hypothetical protein